ncbi:MAG: ABC transporter ATP-binding protein [Oscillospiraceae bacterium]|nr:ABC transporter ATP-binding protein [Oscillospiraceae bacterium]
MKWVFKFLKPLSKRITAGITIKVIGTIAELIIPFLLSYILDHVIQQNEMGKILIFGVYMAICAVVASLGNIIANRMAAKTTMYFATRMRKELFSKTLYLSARSTDAFTIPSLESRITSDTYNVQNFVGMMQRLGIRAPILLLGGTIITMAMDRKLALVMIATLPLIFAVVYGVSRLGVPLYTKVQSSVDSMVRVVREDAQGIRVIKALSKVPFENARYDKANLALKKSETKAATIMGVVNPVMTLLMNSGIVAVIAVSAYFVAKGTSSAATVIAFMQYFTLISMAMMSLSRMFVMYTKCAASAKRISMVLNQQSELKTLDDDGKGDDSYHISFEKVCFSYLGKTNNLSDISFSLKKGQTLGIIGATGSGKSTILRLLMRFYDAGSGTIRINGRDVRSYSQDELTSMFGVVFQNDFIYADTIEENIRFGRDISAEDIVSAAKTAQAHDFITSFADGYSHAVTTGGTNLSGGQRQRLLISRAIAGRPEILVLDDSSSALDYKTDANLRNALSSALPNSTVITVAQRVSSVKNCDLILVIENGAIIGKGKHEELMESCKEYKEISDSQMGGAFLD